MLPASDVRPFPRPFVVLSPISVGLPAVNHESGEQELAAAVIRIAFADLNSTNDERRCSAVEFFLEPDSLFALWCEVVGVDKKLFLGEAKKRVAFNNGAGDTSRIGEEKVNIERTNPTPFTAVPGPLRSHFFTYKKCVQSRGPGTTGGTKMTRKSTTQTKTNGKGVDQFMPYAKDVMALTGERLDVCRSQATLSLKHESIGRARVIIFSGSPESLTICSVFLRPTDKDVKVSSLSERYVTLKNPTAKQVTRLGKQILKRAGLIQAKGKARSKKGGE